MGIACGVAQARIQHQPFGAGVADEHGVVQIALFHAAGFRNRLGEVIGQVGLAEGAREGVGSGETVAVGVGVGSGWSLEGAKRWVITVTTMARAARPRTRKKRMVRGDAR